MAVVENKEQNESSQSTSTQEFRPTPRRNTGGLIRRIGLILILFLAAALTYWKIKSNNQDADAAAVKMASAANRPIPVTVAPVASRTMPIYFTALGTVTAFNSVTIKSRVDGQLLSVNVREGQQVRQGQVLAMIDPRPYNATVAQAQGQLAKDEAAAANAKAEASRYTALFQAGVVSKESEQVQVSSAGQSAGTLEADRASIQAAKVNVGYTRITSPINGVVGLRQVDAGNIVHASDSNGLLLVTQLQPITIIFTLPEDQLPQVLKLIKGGRKLVVEAYDRSEANRLANGTLLTVDNQIDPTTGTVKVKAIFDNRDGALFPNQFVNIRLILEERANSLVVPAAALQTGTNGTFVYLVKPGAPPRQPDDAKTPEPTAPKSGADPGSSEQARTPPYFVDVQPVAVDLTEGSQVILNSGVNAGDEIVVDGQEKLKRYSKVIPKSAAPGGGRRSSPAGSSGASSTGSPVSANGGRDQPVADPGGSSTTPAPGDHRRSGAGQQTAGQGGARP